MGANNRQRQKKSFAAAAASSSFSLLSFFSGSGGGSRNLSRARRVEDSSASRDYESVKAYKVYPSDEDRGRWVAEPGIDKKASAYITLTTDKWEKLAVSN